LTQAEAAFTKAKAGFIKAETSFAQAGAVLTKADSGLIKARDGFIIKISHKSKGNIKKPPEGKIKCPGTKTTSNKIVKKWFI
jgi:hypothetical protein